ncbi:sulfatase family protein [Proteiniphilum sp. UBA7639]|uniref:sulfatase family protein n=1 Tax=Proteiniphilum sp. UBA7639 TaxID=1947289 RepID=UPI00257AA3D1|nr:sulfatase-like hydrolase/transferase [Proteiniphilum sp. UBA7639]
MNWKNRVFGVIIFIWIIILSGSKPKKRLETKHEEYPNIILLMGDDHGWDEVGYNGHPFVKTPILDEMAKNGVRFDRFYAAHPNSSPTRASVLTGRHPNRYGTFAPGWSLRPEEITIAQILKDAGYTTAHFGKWHVGPVKKDSPTSPGAMGFNEWYSHDNFFDLNPVLSRNGESPKKVEGEGSAIIIDETIQFIEKSIQEAKPFFTVVWFGSPHEPYGGLPDDLALYENLPDSLAERKVTLTSNITGEQVVRPLKDVLQERYAEITAMDRAIGKLRHYLKENKLTDNTLVWYCGDNGSPPEVAHTGITFREEKGSLYEGGIRVPGIIEWPERIKKPASISSIAATSDILPTLADIINTPLPARPIDGVSLVPFLKKPTGQRKSPLFFWKMNPKSLYNGTLEPYIEPKLQQGTTPLLKKAAGKFTRDFTNFKYNTISINDFGGERSMMKNQYKLVIKGLFPDKEIFELYDIPNDPEETNNLVHDFPDIVREMRLAMHDWQESVLESLTGADY